MIRATIIAAVALVGAGLVAAGIATAGSSSGAVFTTNLACNGVDLNLYAEKDDVYIDGGPHHEGAAGLDDGAYYVKVTEPNGDLLGTSIGSGNDTPVTVADGEFVTCYQLSAILVTESDGTPGYDTTTNNGGEYKVWVCNQDPTAVDFSPSSCKTDNFKVKTEGGVVIGPAELQVLKFYDANANGINDDGQLITGWKVLIQDDLDWIRWTPVDMLLDPDDYTVTEFDPVETNWIHTTPAVVDVTLAEDDEQTVEFGNVCLGAGGGKTLGFWSNKNGQALFGSGDLALMVSLNLRNANGDAFNPGNYSAFRTWLLSANATNMAYMLSAQLAAMELNVLNGFVNGGALIYAPGATSANALGFTTVNALMTEANTELGLHGLTLADSPYRAYQEALKNALDAGNNNHNFVQPVPCAFSFLED